MDKGVKPDRLKVAEHFVSLQGEGKTVGVPAIFWRFSGCTLACEWCDTIEVWRRGKVYDFEDLYLLFASAGYFERLNRHSHHLVITGGDPLMQQEAICSFLDFCESKGNNVPSWFVECENHGSLMPSARMLERVKLWNISPKLTNSGMPERKRLVPEVIGRFVRDCHAIFKFPVAEETDILEVLAFQRRYSVQTGRIWLMPICSTREAHTQVGAKVAEMCVNYGFRFSPRLQLVLWDQTVGV